jgi:surface antigen
MRKVLAGACLAAVLGAIGSTSASGAIAVLDQRPSLQLGTEMSQSAPAEHEPRVILAGPPRWAPAHGFRRKPGKHRGSEVHVHHHHHHDQDDDAVLLPLPEVGIDRGFCDRELIGGLLGGIAGGALGSQVGQGGTRTVATIGGTLVGVLIGGTIGRRMDEADHACVSHIVAYGESGSVVAWNGPAGERYHVVPLAAAYKDVRGRTCRDFETIALVDGVRRSERTTACRRPNGSWYQES